MVIGYATDMTSLTKLMEFQYSFSPCSPGSVIVTPLKLPWGLLAIFYCGHLTSVQVEGFFENEPHVTLLASNLLSEKNIFFGVLIHYTINRAFKTKCKTRNLCFSLLHQSWWSKFIKISNINQAKYPSLNPTIPCSHIIACGIR